MFRRTAWWSAIRLGRSAGSANAAAARQSPVPVKNAEQTSPTNPPHNSLPLCPLIRGPPHVSRQTHHRIGRLSTKKQKIGHVVARTPRDVVDCMLVVDDGSTDRTAEAARSGGAEVLSLPAVIGVGAALRAGLDHARKIGSTLP